LVIVDDYFRYTWTLFIVTKDYAFTTFKILSRTLQNENDSNICVNKINNGGEFHNERSEKFYDKYGIKHNFLAPRRPQQNGVGRKEKQVFERIN